MVARRGFVGGRRGGGRGMRADGGVVGVVVVVDDGWGGREGSGLGGDGV